MQLSIQSIIIGNKCDLEDKRKVTLEEGQSYAKEKGVEFMEVSALKTINVKETFITLAHNLLNKKINKTEIILVIIKLIINIATPCNRNSIRYLCK